jgi:hypothetical protein
MCVLWIRLSSATEQNTELARPNLYVTNLILEIVTNASQRYFQSDLLIPSPDLQWHLGWP